MAGKSISLRVSDKMYAQLKKNADAKGLKIATLIKSVLTETMARKKAE